MKIRSDQIIPHQNNIWTNKFSEKNKFLKNNE